MAAESLKAEGAKRVLPLPVSAPFHTPMMQHAAEVLQAALTEMPVQDPVIPVISNVNGEAQINAEAIRTLLVDQIVSPVRWTGCMATMMGMGCRRFIECGPGRVLTGLTRRIAPEAEGFVIETPDQLQVALNTVIGEPSP